MLKNINSFAILLAENDTNILDVVQKLSLRKQIRFNRCKLNGDTDYSYVLYTELQDKQYVFDMARNKKLKMIWKAEDEFYIIDFKNNTRGDIISYLSVEDIGTDAGKIEGDVITLNLKQQFNGMKKVPLVSSEQLDEEQPENYEHFIFYIKNIE